MDRKDLAAKLGHYKHGIVSQQDGDVLTRAVMDTFAITNDADPVLIIRVFNKEQSTDDGKTWIVVNPTPFAVPSNLLHEDAEGTTLTAVVPTNDTIVAERKFVLHRPSRHPQLTRPLRTPSSPPGSRTAWCVY